MGRWDDQTTLKFIALYQKNECLWNVNTPDYRNRKTRIVALTEIVDEMDVPGFGIAEAKIKIRNLRSTYSQELTKIENSVKSGATGESVYVPSLKWFCLMHSFIVMMNRKQNDRISLESISDVENGDHDSKYNIVIDQEIIQGSPSIENEDSNDARRSKIRRLSPTIRGEDTAVRAMSDDEYEIFGKHVASQLRRMTTQSHILCQEEIQRVITQYRLQDYQNTMTMPNV